MACGRCQSAGAAVVSSGCGVGRAGTHRYRGIDIPRTPFPLFAAIERIPKPLGFRSAAHRVPSTWLVWQRLSEADFGRLLGQVEPTLTWDTQ
ncbi:MAG: hypothetical protein RLZZ436_3617 [Planctomycetota bacterium]